jgi:hypothetical protein
VRVFKNTWFSRFAEKEAIGNEELKGIVDQLEAGWADADLGGGVYKQRIARTGAGKSGGYRVIVFFRSGALTFFTYGFAKSEMGNINRRQLKNFKTTAKNYLALTGEQINERLKNGILIEI